jgi:hypothetical protein
LTSMAFTLTSRSAEERIAIAKVKARNVLAAARVRHTRGAACAR